jgi:hypothetical protein
MLEENKSQTLPTSDHLYLALSGSVKNLYPFRYSSSICNEACIRFGASQLSRDEIAGKQVIAVGELNINGSLRQVVEALEPLSYLGVDLVAGPGVDEICDTNNLLAV